MMLEPWTLPLAKALDFSKKLDPKELKSETQRKYVPYTTVLIPVSQTGKTPNVHQ